MVEQDYILPRVIVAAPLINEGKSEAKSSRTTRRDYMQLNLINRFRFGSFHNFEY